MRTFSTLGVQGISKEVNKGINKYEFYRNLFIEKLYLLRETLEIEFVLGNSNEEMTPSISHRMSSRKLRILIISMKELYVSKFFKYCAFSNINSFSSL